MEFIPFSGDVTFKSLIAAKDSVSFLLRKVEQRLHLSKVTNMWSCCSLQALPHTPGFASSAAAMAVAVSPAVLLVVVSSLTIGGVLSHTGKSDVCVQI